ncbi:helix-turn-helix domain-containing protein [Heyndrickxia sporothermodurans]|uniref:helix-turn-helix domain-containing protein n=1 Tax=Heyndrickxia sporothermodurans TaxID=46224 RepID=UPI002E2392C1|nr:helix-turn-helix domain-containing protein [Heyndrickxia sporothermodurans]MED3698329.1 helix-turn-helix domain-containing protein [Heyndrickxia sporothermodurans]MED3781499.1 helix-turn-helix domain-containing protein [Heyndrickxia sporothermodurans]
MIGKQIKKYRLAKNITLSELAEQAGVAKSYISSLERGIQLNPSIHFLAKISNVLEIPVETLLQSEESLTNEMELEWKVLLRDAINSGMTKEQFREFLEFRKWKKDH